MIDHLVVIYQENWAFDSLFGTFPGANGLGNTLPLGRFARDYVLCDNFFQAAFGGSFLNHVWLIAAATPRWPEAPAVLRAQLEGERLLRDGDVTPDGYIINTAYTINAPHPPTITDRGRLAPSFSLPTIGDRLSERGVSWRWYSGGWNDTPRSLNRSPIVGSEK